MSLYQCPECKQATDFSIGGIAYPRCNTDEDGNVYNYLLGDIEWDERSIIICNKCDHQGIIKEFRNETD